MVRGMVSHVEPQANEVSASKDNTNLVIIYKIEILPCGVIGSTTDSGSVCLGSSPSGAANKDLKHMASNKIKVFRQLLVFGLSMSLAGARIC